MNAEVERAGMTRHLMNAFPRIDLQPVRGEGCYLFDSDGRRYLDFLAGVAVNALGHCHPGLTAALCQQAQTLWHASNLVRVPPQERLADRICAASFAEAVFFTNSGSESIDFALKLVRRYFKTTPTPERWRVITFADAFHGRSMAGVAAGGQAKLTQGFEPVVPGFDCVPFGDIDAVRRSIGPETGAIIFEPVQGDGGIRVFPFPFVTELRRLADEHGLLLVVDEVQTGFGRTGKLFGFEWSGITPDIVACAKGLGAGFPMGAVLTSERVGACIKPGSHGSTLGGSFLAAAVGNALLDVLLGEGFLEHAYRMGGLLRSRLETVAAARPTIIAEVRGLGLMLGLQCSRVENKQMMAALRTNGLLSAPGGFNVVRLLPPLIVDETQVDEAVAAVRAACDQLEAKSPEVHEAAHA